MDYLQSTRHLQNSLRLIKQTKDENQAVFEGIVQRYCVVIHDWRDLYCLWKLGLGQRFEPSVPSRGYMPSKCLRMEKKPFEST